MSDENATITADPTPAEEAEIFDDPAQDPMAAKNAIDPLLEESLQQVQPRKPSASRTAKKGSTGPAGSNTAAPQAVEQQGAEGSLTLNRKFVSVAALMAQPGDGWQERVAKIKDTADHSQLCKALSGANPVLPLSKTVVVFSQDNPDDGKPPSASLIILSNPEVVVAMHAMDKERLSVLQIDKSDAAAAQVWLNQMEANERAKAAQADEDEILTYAAYS